MQNDPVDVRGVKCLAGCRVLWNFAASFCDHAISCRKVLALFRNNQVSSALILAIYVAVLHLPAMLGWVAPAEHTEGGQGFLFRETFGWLLASPRLSAIGATLLVFIQALLVNRLVDMFRMMTDRNWVPGAMYALAASCLPDFLFLSAPLVAVTVLPLALARLFSVYKQASAYGAIFDTAFWLTLGCLFHPPVAWLLPVCFIGFFNLRSFNFREQIVFFTGVLAPFMLALTAYFWFDAASAFLASQFSQGLGVATYSLPTDLYGALKTCLLVILILAVLIGFNVYYYKKLIQIQKFITILFWCLFAGLLAALLHGNGVPNRFILLMPSIAIFLSYSIQSLRNAFMAEVFHFALLAAVFFIQFFPAGS